MILTAVVFAAFVVALGYGATLPLLPALIADFLEAPSAAEVARHTALLTATFAIAPLVTAYPWGRLSDRLGRRLVLVLGLVGFSISFAATTVHISLPFLYVERFLTGGFAAAIVPSVLAHLTDAVRDEARRARSFGWVSVASSLGLLGGPVIGGLLADLNAASVPLLFGIVALMGLLAATGMLIMLPHGHEVGSRVVIEAAPTLGRSQRFTLIALSAVAAGGLAVFEVGLTLRSQALLIGPSTLGLMFAGCMVVMLVVQAIAFSPLVRPAATRWFIAPAFLVLGVGLMLTLFGTGEVGLLAATAAVASSGGLLVPMLAFWLARASSGRAGAHLGLQSGLVSVGQVLGSVGAGWLLADPGGSVAVLGIFSVVSGLLGLSVGLVSKPRSRAEASRELTASREPSLSRSDR